MTTTTDYEIISKSFKSGSGNSHCFLPTSPISWNFCKFWLWQFYQLDWKANDTHVVKDHMRQPRHSEVKPIIKSELNMWFKEFFDKLGNIMESATTFSKLRIYLKMELNSIKSWDYKHSNKTLKCFDSTVHWFLNWFDTILILIFDISLMFKKGLYY